MLKAVYIKYIGNLYNFFMGIYTCVHKVRLHGVQFFKYVAKTRKSMQSFASGD